MSIPRVDMSQALAMLEEANDIVQRLDGSLVNAEHIKSKDVNREKAEISKQLLYAAHLTDLARASVLNEYHKFKGENPPEIRA